MSNHIRHLYIFFATDFSCFFFVLCTRHALLFMDWEQYSSDERVGAFVSTEYYIGVCHHWTSLSTMAFIIFAIALCILGRGDFLMNFRLLSHIHKERSDNIRFYQLGMNELKLKGQFAIWHAGPHIFSCKRKRQISKLFSRSTSLCTTFDWIQTKIGVHQLQHDFHMGAGALSLCHQSYSIVNRYFKSQNWF